MGGTFRRSTHCWPSQHGRHNSRAQHMADYLNMGGTFKRSTLCRPSQHGKHNSGDQHMADHLDMGGTFRRLTLCWLYQHGRHIQEMVTLLTVLTQEAHSEDQHLADHLNMGDTFRSQYMTDCLNMGGTFRRLIHGWPSQHRRHIQEIDTWLNISTWESHSGDEHSADHLDMGGKFRRSTHCWLSQHRRHIQQIDNLQTVSTWEAHSGDLYSADCLDMGVRFRRPTLCWPSLHMRYVQAIDTQLIVLKREARSEDRRAADCLAIGGMFRRHDSGPVYTSAHNKHMAQCLGFLIKIESCIESVIRFQDQIISRPQPVYWFPVVSSIFQSKSFLMSSWQLFVKCKLVVENWEFYAMGGGKRGADSLWLVKSSGDMRVLCHEGEGGMWGDKSPLIGQ